MRRITALWFAVLLALLVACRDAPHGGDVTAPAPASTGPEQGAVDPAAEQSEATVLVLAGVQALLSQYYEELDPARLFADAWEGAAEALRAAGAEPVPAPPSYPPDAAAAAAVHQQTFPTLEQIAAGRLSVDKLAGAALHALAIRRSDPHTSYRSRELVLRDQATRQGDAAVQIGLGFSRSAPPRVVRVPPGSPAERAGLLAGQRILAVNGVSVTSGADIPALVDVRAGVPNTFTVEGIGGRIEHRTVIPAVYVRPIEDHEVQGRIGLLRLYGFPGTDQVVRRVRAALDTFERAGAEGWILDLRDNSGGVAESVAAVASLFLERGPLFQERQRGRTVQTTEADGSVRAAQKPLMVLAGPGSFSGGEILPAVLRARGRAVVVGEQTGGGFGSSVTVPLPDGSALNVTTTEVVIAADGQRLNRVGLTPDVVVPRTLEDVVASRDPQLAAAISLLNDRLR